MPEGAQGALEDWAGARLSQPVSGPVASDSAAVVTVIAAAALPQTEIRAKEERENIQVK